MDFPWEKLILGRGRGVIERFFRSQGENRYGKIYDVFVLKEFVKVTSIETLGDYVQAP